uniref:Uncharacterized protein n=1 Tax=Astatotilapia calliptera TaxID=8154 RepID=A0AAX7SEU2_ASTCA
MLQGPYSSLDRDRLLIRLPFKSFAVGTVLLPVTGFIFIACIFISLWYHYEDATYTHCKVGDRGHAAGGQTILSRRGRADIDIRIMKTATCHITVC